MANHRRSKSAEEALREVQEFIEANGGIVKKEQLGELHIDYRRILEFVEEGKLVRIKNGYYTDRMDRFTEEELIARLFPDEWCTVVTNSIDILVVLAHNPRIRLVFAGGVINKSRDGFWGGMTLDFISRLKPDIAFVGAVGVDVKENSVSTYDIEDGINKAAIIRSSKHAYVVAEARKLSTDGNYNYATLDTLSGIITDTLPAEDICKAAADYGIQIVLP